MIEYMDILGQVQTVVTENAFTIGLGLLVAVLLAAVAWYSMSRLGSSAKNSVLVNQARVNQADLNPDTPSQEGLEKQEEQENTMDAQMQQVNAQVSMDQ
jgi:hypothetical protein